MRYRFFFFLVVFGISSLFSEPAAASLNHGILAEHESHSLRSLWTGVGQSDADPPVVLVQEDIAGEAEWTPDFVYVLDRDIRVLPSGRLVIQAGTIVKFRENSRLLIEGALQARGADQSGGWVVFTSYMDDQNGGDTNGDGSASAPAPGDWGWIKFEDSSLDAESRVEHSLLLYGGKHHLHKDELRGVLFLESASPAILRNVLTANTNGIWLEGSSTPTVRENLFYQNEGLAVVNENKVRGKPVILDAEDNWWGHASGPQDPTDDKKDPTGLVNALGRGSLVSDMVDYAPWLVLPSKQAYLQVFEDALPALPGHPVQMNLVPGTTFRVAVPAGCGPSAARVVFGDLEAPLAGPGPDNYWSAVLAAPQAGPQDVIPLSVNLQGGDCGDQTLTLAEVVVIPPTGTITDARTGQPVAGARVTLFYYDWKGKSAYYWPAHRNGQANPQVTGEQGWFGWSAPPGQYAIEVEMPGYDGFQSDWITTPLGTEMEIDLEPEGWTAPVYVPFLIR